MSSLVATAMRTKLLIPAILRKYSPDEIDVSFEGDTVGDLLREVGRSHPDLYVCICDETGQLRRHINLFLNDDLFDRHAFNTKLNRDAVVSVSQAVSGG